MLKSFGVATGAVKTPMSQYTNKDPIINTVLPNFFRTDSRILAPGLNSHATVSQIELLICRRGASAGQQAARQSNAKKNHRRA
jgi:hypothetical protein